MKYFITAAKRQGSLYFEFQKGHFVDKFWLDDSLYLHVDTFDELEMYDLFSRAIPHFQYYARTKVTLEDWQTLLTLAHECGGSRDEVIIELASWAEDCFKSGDMFTICGI